MDGRKDIVRVGFKYVFRFGIFNVFDYIVGNLLYIEVNIRFDFIGKYYLIGCY